MPDSAIGNKVERLEKVVFGPPYPGLEARVNAFIYKFEAIETLRHEENQEKLSQISNRLGQRSLWVTVAGVAIALAGLMVSIAAVMATVYIARHAELEPMKMFSHPSFPVVSYEQAPQVSGAGAIHY